jgi:hypothetical protein
VLFFAMAVFALSLALAVPNMFDIVKILPIKFSYLENYQEMTATGLLLLLCLVQITYPAIKFIENIKSWIKSLSSYFINVIRKIR